MGIVVQGSLRSVSTTAATPPPVAPAAAASAETKPAAPAARTEDRMVQAKPSNTHFGTPSYREANVEVLKAEAKKLYPDQSWVQDLHVKVKTGNATWLEQEELKSFETKRVEDEQFEKLEAAGKVDYVERAAYRANKRLPRTPFDEFKAQARAAQIQLHTMHQALADVGHTKDDLTSYRLNR